MTSQPVTGNGWIAVFLVALFIVAIGAANLVINSIAWALGR